jgi:hypothetical protein
MATDKTPVLSFERGTQVGFVTGAFATSMILAAIWPSSCHADAIADKVFGPWKSIRVEQISIPVPEFEYPRTLPGAVSKSETSKPDPDACPLFESGKVVGFRFNCPASDRRAAHGGPPVPSASGS